jgi:hypothetical protein
LVNDDAMERIDRAAPALADLRCNQGCSGVKQAASSAGLMFDTCDYQAG